MSDFESKYKDFQGKITTCAVNELPGETTPFDTVIRADKPWFIHLAWQVEGLGVDVMAGEWHINAYLESMGPGPEFKLWGTPHIIPLKLGQTNYVGHFHIPANAVPVDAMESTPYKLVVTVVYRKPNNVPGPMAGFYELPVMQFYTAVP